MAPPRRVTGKSSPEGDGGSSGSSKTKAAAKKRKQPLCMNPNFKRNPKKAVADGKTKKTKENESSKSKKVEAPPPAVPKRPSALRNGNKSPADEKKAQKEKKDSEKNKSNMEALKRKVEERRKAEEEEEEASDSESHSEGEGSVTAELEELMKSKDSKSKTSTPAGSGDEDDDGDDSESEADTSEAGSDDEEEEASMSESEEEDKDEKKTAKDVKEEEEKKLSSKPLVRNSSTHKKEWDAFDRAIKNRKAFPVDLSQYVTKSKTDLFGLWLDSGRSWDKCRMLAQRKHQNSHESLSGYVARRGQELVDQFGEAKASTIMKKREEQGLCYDSEDFPGDPLERWYYMRRPKEMNRRQSVEDSTSIHAEANLSNDMLAGLIDPDEGMMRLGALPEGSAATASARGACRISLGSAKEEAKER